MKPYTITLKIHFSENTDKAADKIREEIVNGIKRYSGADRVEFVNLTCKGKVVSGIETCKI